MNERIQKLKDQIEELKQWKKDNSIQQIPFNPPVNVDVLMHIDHFEMQPTYTFSPNTKVAIEVLLDTTIYYLPAFLP